MAKAKPLCALAMPRRGPELSAGAAEGFYLWPARDIQPVHLYRPSSLLNHCFNTLWACALNLRKQFGEDLKYFAMIHDDVCPAPHWLDTLAGELERLNADVVSAVIAIKDDRGLTSTAVDVGPDLFSPRRVTLAEALELPETFGPDEIGGPILLNTGLWVCDFTKPWVEEACFHTRERIIPGPDGDFVSQVVSEDWLFSDWLNRRGARLFATRKVAVQHDGRVQFTNEKNWGQWSRDETYYAKLEKAAEPEPAAV